MVYIPGGEWIGSAVRPQDGTAEHGGSIPPASTPLYDQYGYKLTDGARVLPESRPVTWKWGEPYPCEAYRFDQVVKEACGGWMQPGVAFGWAGRWWRKWKCGTCGREATDHVKEPRDFGS